MKKLYFLLLLFSGMMNAQIVNIPDANFKAKLIALGVDTNADGNIQQSEALAVTTLNVSSSSILYLTGISSFTNLVTLNCSSNGLTSLDVSALINLGTLDCSYNHTITSLNITGLTNLVTLNCSANVLTSLNVSALTNLVTLDCGGNSFSSLDVSALGNLVTLNCNNNTLTSLNLTGLTNLVSLNCRNDGLTSLDVSTLVNLQSLICEVNQLTTLNLAGLVNLAYLDFVENNLSDLDLTSLPNLTQVRLGNVTNTLNLSNSNVSSITSNGSIFSIGTLNLSNCTNLTSIQSIIGTEGYNIGTLNVSNCTSLTQLILPQYPFFPFDNIILTGCTAMTSLRVDGNYLYQLDVSSLTNLQTLYCRGNFIETLDVSNNFNLTSLNAESSALHYLYAKNGQGAVSFGTVNGSQNLIFACVDDIQVGTLVPYPGTTPQISSYCTFIPGGNYNTITGAITFDADNNGCDALDLSRPNIRININDGTNQGATFTSNSGNYFFYRQTGSFDITLNIENPTWFTFSPTTATIPFANNNNNTTTQNFCIAANGIHPDVEVVIVPIAWARPGFDAQYKIVYKNKGNQTLSGNVTFSYDDAVLDFVSSTVIPTSQSTGSLNYDYTNLLPFENRSFYITLNVNAPTDTPPVNIGDNLNFTATVNPIAGDEIPSDNTFQFNQTVVGSFDPNDITCIEGNIVSPAEIGNYLHYVINFENTGTADAENIVVRDVIDTAQFDVNTLQVLNSSAQVTARLTSNVAEFIFPNINLHSGGHGNILIKIKSKNTLVQGETVSKRANIYFDYNAPINTNQENTTFQSLNNPDFEADASISVYPNPTKGNVTISCNNNINSVQLYDVQGRLLQTSLVNENEIAIDISGQSNGVYFLKIISDKGMKVQKIVRE